MNSIFKTFILSLMIIANTHLAYAQTASILPPAKTTFLDSNGNPLTAGTVTSYIPGTTTKKMTWQDAAETIPNQNPLTLDAAGRALLLGSGSYRQVVKDRNNNLIWDQVTSSTGSGGGGGTTATGDGDLVGTIKPWAGMTAPNQYAFTYGQEISRATYSVLFTAITSAQAAFCTSGSAVLSGLSDTTNFWIGMPVEISCVAAGFSTIISKTATTVTLAASANVTVNTNATFLPWGRGNGATTFNLPDFRGVPIAGNNNMGGTPSSNLTATYFGATNPNSVGALGGSQSASITLLTANLPPYTPGGSFPKPSGVMDVSDTLGGSANALVRGTIAATVPQSNYLNFAVQTFTGSPQGGTSTPIVTSIIQPTKTSNYIIKITPDSNSATASGVTSIQGMTGDIACGAGLSCTGNIVSSSINTNTVVQWITPQSKGALCNGVADDTIALQNALDAQPSGGIVYTPAGSICMFSAALVPPKRRITILGVGNKDESLTMPSKWTYTGTGSRAIDARDAFGFRIDGMQITYSNSSFTGALIDIGSAAPGTGVSAYTTLYNSFFGSNGQVGTATLISHSDAVNTTIEKNYFYHGAPSILGMATQGRNTRTTLLNNTFAFSDSVTISSCGDSWVIEGNSFEPTSGGQAQAFGNIAALYCKGMVWKSNWFGDVTVDGGTWIDGYFRGIEFAGNVMSGLSGGTNTTGIKLNSSVGASIFANRLESLNVAVNCVAANQGIGVYNNITNAVTTLVSNGAACFGLNTNGNAPPASLQGNAQVMIGQTGDDPLPKTLSGAITLTATGLTTIQAGVVDTTMLASNVFSTAHTWTGIQTIATPVVSVTTVSALPACAAGTKSMRSFVTDNNTALAFAAVITTGGTIQTPVYCDGTVWRQG